MKYAVHIRSKILRAMEDDNLKGERRWERHVAKALLDAGRPTGSLEHVWVLPDSPHWIERIESLNGYTLITEADPGNVQYHPGADYWITNAFSILEPAAEAQLRHAIAEMGRDRIALTHSFQPHVPSKRLPEDLHDIIHWLPPPLLPKVHYDHDGFVQKNLLWSARAIHLYLMTPTKPVLDLLDWIRTRMLEDKEILFELLIGEEDSDQARAEWWVWRFPEFKDIFWDLRERLIIHASRSWTEVQEAYSRAKLVVNAAMKFGGPPVEAASFGIPFALTAPVSVFHTADKTAPEPSHTGKPAFPEVTLDIGAAAGNKTLVEHLDQWYRDPVEYHRIGDAYRRYVDETYTYASFVRHLDALPVFK